MFQSRGPVRHFETFQKIIILRVRFEKKIKDLIISKCCKVVIYPKYDGFQKFHIIVKTYQHFYS